MKPPPEPDQPESEADPDLPADAADELLAELLDACLQAEYATPGTSAPLIQSAPEQMRDELAQLVALGLTLRQRSSGFHKPDPTSRMALRMRIIRQLDRRASLHIVSGSIAQRVSWSLRHFWRWLYNAMHTER